MIVKYENIRQSLLYNQRTWLITGVAGFIGSNILEALLTLNQKVIGVDNYATGYRHNLEDVKSLVTSERWNNFKFIYGTIEDADLCHALMQGVDFVVHQAALGSVPRSIENPRLTNQINVSGFLNILIAANEAKVKKFIYAASSSTYGDSTILPKVEGKIGEPLSPYAVSKYTNELYANVFKKCYGLDTVGLRYFNVFGPRQDPSGSYAAVIPKWMSKFLNGQNIIINGDGTTSRDFCYVANVVQANILCAFSDTQNLVNQVFNVAFGNQTSLYELASIIQSKIEKYGFSTVDTEIIYQEFRAGDIKHSLASIDFAKEKLGYEPVYDLSKGLDHSVEWYTKNHNKKTKK